MKGHDERIRDLASFFTSANRSFIARLEGLSDAAAERAPEGGWTAAQLGSHVAATNELLARIIAGTFSSPPQPDSPQFSDEEWGPHAIPPKVESPEPLLPPPTATRAEALGRLRASEGAVCRAIAGLSAERGSGERAYVLFGNLSLYQVADLAGRHVMKHLLQAERALAGS